MTGSMSFKAMWGVLLLLQFPMGYYLLTEQKTLKEALPQSVDEAAPALTDQAVLAYLRNKGMEKAALELTQLLKEEGDTRNHVERLDIVPPTIPNTTSNLAATPSTTTTTTTKKNKFKPKLYIHIGPSKTGTTTLQLESVAWNEILNQDSYQYLGRYAPLALRRPANIAFLFDEDDCFREAARAYEAQETTSFLQTECWAKKMEVMETYRHQNISIVLSDEAFSYARMYGDNLSPNFYHQLRIALQDWDPVVVPTYRRYHEWYLSAVKEINSKRCLGADQHWAISASWPHEGGQACRNLWRPFREALEEKDVPFKSVWGYTTLDKSIPIWQKAGFPIRMLDFHQREKHLTCAFYCDIVTDAPHTCRHCQQQKGSKSNANSVASSAYNDIVFFAAERGILIPKEGETRIEAAAKLMHYHTVTLGRRGFLDLPLRCPTKEELKRLLKKSLEYEEVVVPEIYNSTHGKEEHEREFWRLAKQERVFCWVNKGALLRGKKSWDEVLEALRTTEKWPVEVTNSLPREKRFVPPPSPTKIPRPKQSTALTK